MISVSKEEMSDIDRFKTETPERINLKFNGDNYGGDWALKIKQPESFEATGYAPS